jgi:predicted ATPase/DNA-binding SARP family transcriptional activator
VLGAVEAHEGAEVLAVGGPRQRAVLGVLALARPAVVPIEQLADAVWAGAPPRTAEHTLHNYVLRLRRLGIVIERIGDGYRLDSPTDADELQAAVDATHGAATRATLRRLTDALALVRGAPGHGVPDGDLTRAPRAALVELVESAREDAAAAASELAGSRAAVSRQIPQLRELVTAAPYRERRWELLILGLYRAGRQSDALEAFGEARELLARELGIDPGPDLVRLQQQVLSQDPGLLTAERGDGSGKVAVGGRALPGLATRLVGRAVEREALLAALTASRLVTVTGPLGAGKTRIALEVARADAGPVWFVPLEDLAAPTTVTETVAGVIAPDSRADGPVAAIAAVLSGAPGLLVLDGAEQVVSDVADLARRLLIELPELRMLVTSRQRLRLKDEAVVALDSLTVDDSRELLLDRARLGTPGFTLAEPDRDVADRLCALVDGLPLGIELVARHLRLLSMRDLADRVDADLDRWTSGDDTSAGLVSAVAASIDGLDPAERDLLLAMAVFPAEVDLTLAHEVAAPGADPDAVFDAIATLVDRSLIQVRSGAAGIRYGLLLSVRRHLLGRLDPARLRALESAYVDAVLRRAERAAAAVTSAERAATIAGLDADLPHLRLALAAAVDGGDSTDALRAAAALGPYWLARRPSEGMAWLSRLIVNADLGGTDRAAVLLQMGHLAYWLTDFDRGERLLVEARDLLSGDVADADQVLLGRILRRLGAVAAARDDVTTARLRLEASLEVLERSGDPVEAAISKLHLGSLLADESQTDAALPLLSAARDALRAADDAVQEAHALSALSLAWWKAGDLSAALGAGEQAASRFASLGHHPSEGVVSYRLAATCRALGRSEDSRRYATLALGIGDETGTRTTSALARLGLARLDLDADQPAAAAEQVTRALEMIDTAADRWVLAEALEVLGRLLVTRGSSAARVFRVAGELRELIGQPASPAERTELEALAARAGRVGRATAPTPDDAAALRGWALDLCWSAGAGTSSAATVSQPG